MLSKNVNKILNNLKNRDKVLDIGGWTRPFNRANYVIDIMPYETRGIHGYVGLKKEFFSSKNWIIQDVSTKKRLPFKDKEIDFVVCSQILEDIRDPLYLCAEIIRVGKAGYIEVPSRVFESVIGVHGKHYTGYPHHRWLVEINKNKITFRFKYHLIHESWKYHLPQSYLKRLNQINRVSFLFWQDKFEYQEIINISPVQVANELEEYIKKLKYYPNYYYFLYNLINPRPLIKNMLLKYPKLRKLAERVFGRVIRQGLEEEQVWRTIKQYPE